MNGFLLDVRYALRSLRQGPGFAVAAALTLALGIGANTLLFSVIQFVLLRPIPYADPDRLVFVAERQPALPEASLAYPTFLDLRGETGQVFSHFAAFRRESFNLTGAGEPERLRGRMVSADLFPALGAPAALGRIFRSDEDGPGAPRTAVLSWELWQRRFGGDRTVLGRSIELNGEPYEVIGVLHREFRFFSGADVYVPIGLWQDVYRERGHHPGIYGIGRLRPGVTPARALAVLDSVHERLEEQYPQTNKGSHAKLELLREQLIGEVRTPLLVLWGAVAMVLLIAGANVANLLLARASARQQEIAVRLAMGASRPRLVRQLLTESALLALAGGGAGVLLAIWGIDAIRPFLPPTILRVGDLRLDWPALAFTLALSLAAAALFGLVPALRASSIDLHAYLKEGRAVVGGTRGRLRSGLVVAEVALALVLLIGAGLLLRSFARLTRVQPGFDPAHVITLSMSLSPARYGSSEALVRFARDLRERAAALPGVAAAALTYGLPLGEAADQSVWPEGRPQPVPGGREEAVVYATTPGYLEAMRIALLRGRFFTEGDGDDHPVCVIDDAFARKLFLSEEPLGRRLIDAERGPGKGPEVVGVVGHVLQFGLDGAGPVQLGMYLPYRATAQRMPRFAGSLTLVVRTAGDPRALEPALREAVRAIDPAQPVFGVQTMEESVSRSLGDRRFSLSLLGAFAALAVVLALVGIYGVMSYSVSQRTREIGIRMALGAAQSHVLGLVVAQGAKLAALGVAIGITVALALSRVLRTLLFGVTATDPVTYAVIGIALAVVALGACWLPARRAARVDPAIALRAE